MTLQICTIYGKFMVAVAWNTDSMNKGQADYFRARVGEYSTQQYHNLTCSRSGL